ncbi:MAG TPA: pyrroline-5-carboxylate reductase [Candidatus Dormibacteraeota bacterium]|nr:pyrroline-5-carboxylate reductase [Candidatus Dormibacteraeota bacterium]
MNLTIVGYGTLGHALADGFRRAKQDWSIRIARRGDDLADAVVDADIVLVCVKPFQVSTVLAELSPALKASQLVVSAAARVSLSQLREGVQGRSLVARVMPNLPARVLAGMTAIAFDDDYNEGLERVEELFTAVGRTVRVAENLMDAATAMNGCGPAYAYLIVEAWIDAGIKLGFSYETARLLVAQTLYGAAATVLESSEHPAALKTAVTTPAGCTIEGLMQLEDGKLRSTIMRAVIASARP